MRKAGLLILLAVPFTAFSQGTVTWANFTGQEVMTNCVARGGPSGNIAPAPSGFYFALLTAPAYISSVDASLQTLLSAPWSDTGLRATNTTFATGGRVFGGFCRTATNWPVGTRQSFIVVGWSANEGTDWTDVSAKLLSAHLSPANGGAYWMGGQLVDGGFVGASTIQSAIPGGGSAPIPPYPIYGAAMSAQGSPISSPMQLFVVGSSPPFLNISHSSGNILVRWPTSAGTGFILECTADLASPVWTALSTNGPVVGSNYQLTFAPTNSARFLRLRQ